MIASLIWKNNRSRHWYLLQQGGMGPECQKLNKHIAESIQKEEYSQDMKHEQCKLRFALLKATLIAIRGVRGKAGSEEDEICDISFNLIPKEQAYDSYLQ